MKISEASGRRGRSHYPLLLRQFLAGHTSRGEPSRNFRYRADPTDISEGNGRSGSESGVPPFPRWVCFNPTSNHLLDRLTRRISAEVAIQSLASERLKSTRSGSSTSERAIRTHDLEQTFASPFRAPVNRRSREPALVTPSGRVAPDTTSARSRACWMVGFVLPVPEGIGRGANSAVARLRRSRPTRGGAVWESGERREAGVP